MKRPSCISSTPPSALHCTVEFPDALFEPPGSQPTLFY